MAKFNAPNCFLDGTFQWPDGMNNVACGSKADIELLIQNAPYCYCWRHLLQQWLFLKKICNVKAMPHLPGRHNAVVVAVTPKFN